MSTIALSCLLTLSIVAAGCSSPAPIVNHWVHSNEEDTPGVQVYRPSTYAFPPAFGRDGYLFRADGSATIFSVGPADGIEEEPAGWSLSDAGMLTITPRSAGARVIRYQVARIDTGRLELQILR